MRNTSLLGENDVRARLRGMSRLGAICGALAMVVLIAGCPPVTPTVECTSNDQCNDEEVCTTDTCDPENDDADASGCVFTPIENCCESNEDCGQSEVCDTDTNTCAMVCTTDAECDDGAFCNGAETCVDGVCQAGTDPCDEGQDCDEAMDVCEDEPPACDDDTDCDDGLFCNGAETCGDDGVCEDGTAPCEEGETCNEDTDTCDVDVPECEDDADCDDGEFCNGAETCSDDGVCEAGTDPCEEGETCDEDTDTCEPAACESDDDCEEGEVCNLDTGECEAGPIACESDDDCVDDGVFCNGDESCDLDAGVCVSSGDPCDTEAGETCNEDLNTCDVEPPMTLDFTLGLDALTGSGGNDIFSGVLLFNAPTGTNVPSVQTGDTANGGDGTDTANMTFNFAAVTTVAPTFMSIETLNVTDFGTAATTLAGGGLTGVTDINLSNSTNTNAFMVTNLPGIVNLGVSNQAIGATVTLATAATSGGEDEATISVNGMTAGTITYTTGTTNGLETLNIDSSGAASTVADIVMNGTTLTTVNVSGDADLTVTASLDANVETANASGSSGDVSLLQNNAGTFTFTGGSGDDTINLGATYNNLDVLNGGEGSDTLGGTTATLGGTTAVQSNVSNFEEILITDAHTTALDPTDFGLSSIVTLAVGSNGGSITDLSSGSTVNCGARATDPAGAGTLAATVSGSLTTDSLNYVLNDCDQNGAVTFTGAETVNLMSNLDLDGSAASGGANVLGAALTLTDTAEPEKIVVTGTEALTITGAVTADEIDASGFAQALVMSAASATAGIKVTGGSGNDTLFGGTGANSMNGGAGNDIINPLAGSDLVTGGAGADTFRQNSAAANGADRQTISDFDDTVTTGDVFNLNSGFDALDGSDNFATSASVQTHSAAGNLTVNAAAEVVKVTSQTVADLTSANSLDGTNLLTAIGGTITVNANGNVHLYLVADTSGNVGVYYGDPGAADTGVVAGELTLIAVLQGANVTLADMVFNNFSNGA